jgi:hypothetical protein
MKKSIIVAAGAVFVGPFLVPGPLQHTASANAITTLSRGR